MAPHAVVVDPRVNNQRAIRVYQKCGFQILKRLPQWEFHETESHDCYLMIFRPT